MTSRARVLGHAAHQMLIVFPLGLLATAVVFDVLALTLDRPTFAEVAFWMIAAGIVGGVVASLPGWIDWSAIPADTRAKRVGLVHGLGNTVVLALFVASWLLRRDAPESPDTLALVLGFAGGGISLVTGWLGGELVDRLGVGVDDGAHLDAPNSLSGRPARS
ncbi:MAG TPA: DUF2231 domain-containing protein [Rubricoccaceae bacterium]|jgi:uncharacterized membrane protein